MTKSLMGKPRSDELPPLPEPQESLEDESSEIQMQKVMGTEVEELRYWNENTKISGDREKMPYLSLYNQKELQEILVNLFFFQILG